jgi:hypothetical protein
MSMDLGVDTTGKLWFFEANSKPMKFDEPHIREKSLRRLVRFWKYLVSASPGDRPRVTKSLARARRGGRGPAKRRNR